MNLLIPKDALNRALRRVSGAISGRAVNTALSCVLLRAKGKALEVVASNLDMQISCRVEAEIKVPGEALIPFSKLSTFVSLANHPYISISVDDKLSAECACGSARRTIQCAKVEDFTEFPTESRKAFDIDQAALKAALRRTLIAVCKNEERFILCGVHFELAENKLTTVATSGVRLAMVTHEIEGPDLRKTMPTPMVADLISILDEDVATVSFGDRTAQIVAGDTTFKSKLIDGDYVNFRYVIPNSVGERLTVDREEFLSSLRLVASGWDQPNKLQSILLTLANNRMEIKLLGATTDASDNLAVRYSGKDFEIRLAPEQLIDTLAALTDDEIAIEITDALSPFVIKAKDFLALTMPIPKSH